jgi:hypothetical protein
MSTRATALLAWSVWALCVVLAVVAVLLDFYTPPIPTRQGPNFQVLAGLPLLVYPTVGAIVISHRPKNPIGWILCGMGILFDGHAFAEAYTGYAQFAHLESLPSGQATKVLAGWWLCPAVVGAVLLVLLFPSGKLMDRAWWFLVWMAVGGGALVSLWALLPEFFPNGVLGDVLGVLGPVGGIALIVSCIGSVTSAFVRLQNARGDERQQLKWFAYAAAVLLGAFALGPVAEQIGEPWAVFVLVIIGLSAIPVAMGIAILEYRLYDIDAVVNRTLVYGSLTATLVAVYFGGIVVLQGIASVVLQVPIRALTGQETQLATVAATLAIAALFNPLRRRIQGFIDRRFYRKKYDAAKTLETFSAKLRDETDLDALSDDLVGVVRETMQPAHVSLWLRPDTATKGKKGRE